MAYCANYKGHNSFSLLHQRGNHPFSPFTTVSTLSSFSPLLSFSLPLSCLSQNYNMMILKPRGPAGCPHLLGGLSELGPLDFVFHSFGALKLCDQCRWPVHPYPYPAPHSSITHVSMIQTSMIHDTCIDDGCLHYISTM